MDTTTVPVAEYPERNVSELETPNGILTEKLEDPNQRGDAKKAQTEAEQLRSENKKLREDLTGALAVGEEDMAHRHCGRWSQSRQECGQQ